jgi:hypothetical protein
MESINNLNESFENKIDNYYNINFNKINFNYLYQKILILNLKYYF